MTQPPSPKVGPWEGIRLLAVRDRAAASSTCAGRTITSHHLLLPNSKHTHTHRPCSSTRTSTFPSSLRQQLGRISFLQSSKGHPFPFTLEPQLRSKLPPIMKGAGLVAAAALLAGTADAKVHKLKLNKVPLKEQLVRLQPSTSPIFVDDVRQRSAICRCCAQTDPTGLPPCSDSRLTMMPVHRMPTPSACR